MIAGYLGSTAWGRDLTGPRYLQLRGRIEQAIAAGVLAPGDPLPSERAIALVTGFSRVTVRRAIEVLVERGAVVQRRGSGSFVAEREESPDLRVEQSLSLLTSFTADMARRGLATTATFLKRGLFLPSPLEILELGLSGGQRVARIDRLREANGRPLAIERAALPESAVPDPDAVRNSLYAVLEARGLHPVRALQRISAENLSASDAGLLGVAPETAGLRIERRSYLPAGRIIEFTRSLYRADAYDFVAELRLDPDA